MLGEAARSGRARVGIATEDDAQRQAADTELTQLRTMIGSLQDSLADFQKK